MDNGGTVEWWNNCNNLSYHHEILQICTYLDTWVMEKQLNRETIVIIYPTIMKHGRYVHICNLS